MIHSNKTFFQLNKQLYLLPDNNYLIERRSLIQNHRVSHSNESPTVFGCNEISFLCRKNMQIIIQITFNQIKKFRTEEI